jgi:hypothetical protein
MKILKGDTTLFSMVLGVDEDRWQIVVADTYDHDGQLWRVAEAHMVNYYEVPVLLSTLEVS